MLQDNNSNTQTNVSFLRHGAFFGPEDSEDKWLNIIGAGATGSWVAYLAAKMGWQNFRIWDLDVVESHNLPNQVYDINQIGKFKVEALEEKLKQFNPEVTVEIHKEFYTSEKHRDLLEDYVFIAVDSLSARKDIVTGLKHHILVDAILETRMGFQHAEINYLVPSEISTIDKYLNLLKTDEEVVESACNARIITSLTCIIASSVVHNICALAAKDRHESNHIQLLENHDIPSKQIFSLPLTLQTFSLT